MKVSFIQPNVGFKGHTWEALGIGYMISMVHSIYPEVVTDFSSGFYDKDEYILRQSGDSDVVCFSCTSPQYKHALSLAARLKKLNPDVITVFGGAHPSALPEMVLYNPLVDIVVQGEGELPMLEIVRQFLVNSRKKRLFSHSQINDLNLIPQPDRRSILNWRNINQAKDDTGKSITSIFSSRGCPFDCTFCASRCIWQGVRLRSVDNILVELRDICEMFSLDFVKFSDDTFTVNKSRVFEFCAKKKLSGQDVPFGANAHINTVDEKVISSLADAGCEELWFGIESGSPRIRAEMRKSFSNVTAQAVFNLCKQAGIKTRAYFLLGMPNETIEDIKATEILCDKLAPDMVGFTLLSPYPGSDYYDHDKMKDFDWSTFDEYNNDWVRTKTLSNEQLKAEQQRLVAKYQDNAVFRQRVS